MEKKESEFVAYSVLSKNECGKGTYTLYVQSICVEGRYMIMFMSDDREELKEVADRINEVRHSIYKNRRDKENIEAYVVWAKGEIIVIKKYYEDRDYTKEICILKLVEYLEKNDWSTEWLINDYAIYIDEWIADRERIINVFNESLKERNSYALEKAIEEKEAELRELKCIKYLIKNSYKLIEREDK